MGDILGFECVCEKERERERERKRDCVRERERYRERAQRRGWKRVALRGVNLPPPDITFVRLGTADERRWHMPDSQGLGFQAKVPFQVVPSLLGNGRLTSIPRHLAPREARTTQGGRDSGLISQNVNSY